MFESPFKDIIGCCPYCGQSIAVCHCYGKGTRKQKKRYEKMPEKTDKAIEEIKRSLRKSHPNWSEDKIEEVAWQIYNSNK